MSKLAKKVIAIGLASALAAASLATTAYAYFTDQVRASGEREVVFGYDYETNEKIVDKEKVVSIENTGSTEIAVRLMIFGAGSTDNQGRTSINPGEGWQEQQASEGLCYMYTKVLAPGEVTSDLRVALTGIDPESELEEFEVAVIGQASPVAYNDKGNWYPYNWQNQGR